MKLCFKCEKEVDLVCSECGEKVDEREMNANWLCDFSVVLKWVKEGHKISRKGWNGKGMFVVYQKGYPDDISVNKNTQDALGVPEGTVCKFLPYLLMKTVQGDFVPWLASQTDILAEDWGVLRD